MYIYFRKKRNLEESAGRLLYWLCKCWYSKDDCRCHVQCRHLRRAASQSGSHRQKPVKSISQQLVPCMFFQLCLLKISTLCVNPTVLASHRNTRQSTYCVLQLLIKYPADKIEIGHFSTAQEHHCKLHGSHERVKSWQTRPTLVLVERVKRICSSTKEFCHHALIEIFPLLNPTILKL